MILSCRSFVCDDDHKGSFRFYRLFGQEVPAIDRQRFHAARAIFVNALDLDPAAREAYVRRCCAEDPILLDETLDLLANHADGVDPVDGADPWARQAAVPRSVGPWRVIELVGQGGMGIVYRARRTGEGADGDKATGPDVALKVLRATLVGGQAERRFQREIEALRRLDHPGIARLLDAGADQDGTPWLATEFVEGVTLTRWRAESDAGTAARVRLLAELCDAVQAAHDLGIVHRDLKPENILVTPEGRPKVLDFGIARLQSDEAPLATLATQTWQLLGTVRYMSPEQAAGGATAIDARTDIYTLGVIAYELLAGALPYDLARLSTPRALLEITTAEPRPLGGRDRQLELVVQHALEKDPGRRYQAAAAMAEDLRRHLEGRRVSLRPPGPLARARRALRRRPRLRRAMAIAFAVLAVAAVGTGALLATRAAPETKWRGLMARLERADMLRHSGPSTRENWEAAIAAFEQARLDLAGMPDATYRHDIERYVRWRLGELHFFIGDLEHDTDRLEQARGYWRDMTVVPWRRGTALDMDETYTVREKVVRVGRHHAHTGIAYAQGARATLQSPAELWREAASGHDAALSLLAKGEENYQCPPNEYEAVARQEDVAWTKLNLGVALGGWGAVTDSLATVEQGLGILATAVPEGLLTGTAARAIIAEARGTAWVRCAGLRSGAPATAALDSAFTWLDRSLDLRGLGTGRPSWKLARSLAQALVLRLEQEPVPDRDPAAAMALLDRAESTVTQAMDGLRPQLDRVERAEAQGVLAGLLARRAVLARRPALLDRADSLLATADTVLAAGRLPVPAGELALVRAQVARRRFALSGAAVDSARAASLANAARQVIPRPDYPSLHHRLGAELALLAGAPQPPAHAVAAR